MKKSTVLLLTLFVFCSFSYASDDFGTSGEITLSEVIKDKDLVRAQTRFGSLSSSYMSGAVLSLEKATFLLAKKYPKINNYEIDIFLEGGIYWGTVRLEKDYTDFIKKFKGIKFLWESDMAENRTLCFLARMPASSSMSLSPKYTYKSLQARLKKAGCSRKSKTK